MLWLHGPFTVIEPDWLKTKTKEKLLSSLANYINSKWFRFFVCLFPQNIWITRISVPAACMCCSTWWHFEFFRNFFLFLQHKFSIHKSSNSTQCTISSLLSPFLYLQWNIKHVCWLSNVKIVLISSCSDVASTRLLQTNYTFTIPTF